MQIVINISKDDIEEICMQARIVEDIGSLFGRIRKAISHGTPLPKGHGRLIDADELTESTLCKTFGLRDVDIDNAPTIIEAESESEYKG